MTKINIFLRRNRSDAEQRTGNLFQKNFRVYVKKLKILFGCPKNVGKLSHPYRIRPSKNYIENFIFDVGLEIFAQFLRIAKLSPSREIGCFNKCRSRILTLRARFHRLKKALVNKNVTTR